jgi:hypothetical protein
MMITGILALFLCGILSSIRVAAAGGVSPGMGSESTKTHTMEVGDFVGDPVLDLNVDGTTCSGTIRVPLGMTIFLAVRDGVTDTDFIPLYQTLPLKGPVSEVPYAFRIQYAKDETHGKAFLTESHAQGIAFPIRLLTEGTSTEGSGSWRFAAPEDASVDLDLKATLGITVLKRNRIYELATWTIKNGKVTSTSTLKVMVADSPAALHQFKADRTLEPEILHWQDDAESMWKNIKNDPGPSLPGQPDINLTIIPVQNDLTPAPGERQYYQLKSIPSQVVQINLLVGDKLDPAHRMVLKIVKGEGTLVTHVTKDDRTIQFTADLETGGRHYLLSYAKTYPRPVSYVLNQQSFAPAWYLPEMFKLCDLDLMSPYETPKPSVSSSTNFGELGKPGSRLYFSLNGKKYDNPDYPSVRLQVGVQE